MSIQKIESTMRCGQRAIRVEILRGLDAGRVIEARVCRDPLSQTGASVTFVTPSGAGRTVETLPFGRRSDWKAWVTTARRGR